MQFLFNKALKYLFIIYLFFLPLQFANAQTEDTINNNKFSFAPSIAGGQIEVSSLIFVSEFGGLIDIDLFRKEAKVSYSFGTRLTYESYGYFEPGGPTDGGPFNDYCFYIVHSMRSEDSHLSLLGGLAYHTRRSTFQRPNETHFRAGFELRFNFYDKIIGLLIKGSTSFGDRDTFVGFGLAFGFYR